MNTQEKIDILEQAKKIFFKALLAGYVGGNPNNGIIKITSSNGNKKIISYSEGDFVVIDSYWVTPNSDHSSGTTTILYKNNPIWWMSYGGCYPKDVIGFLKSALKSQYEKGSFRGGRGPIRHVGTQFTYRNMSKGIENSDFDHFSGREEILDKEENLLGFHEYFGMSML
jgi:hypothetical protein